MSQEREVHLERLIGYILICGVVLSVIITAYGLLLFQLQTSTSVITFNSSSRVSGSNFFSYVGNLILSVGLGMSASSIMALGLVVLMLTPYIRILASAIYFAWSRNAKYSTITIFVLLLITLSLFFH